MPFERGQKPKVKRKRKDNTGRKGVKMSKHVQANLHPQFAEEAKAIQWYESQIREGFAPRQVICHAFNVANGSTPDMFPIDRDDLIMAKLAEIEHLILSSVIDALNDIKSNPVSRQSFVDDMNDGQNDIGNDTRQNLLKAVASYRRVSRGND